MARVNELLADIEAAFFAETSVRTRIGYLRAWQRLALEHNYGAGTREPEVLALRARIEGEIAEATNPFIKRKLMDLWVALARETTEEG